MEQSIHYNVSFKVVNVRNATNMTCASTWWSEPLWHARLKGLCHHHTFYYYKMLFCILILMEVMILSYSSYVFENIRFWQIPEVNPSLKTRFPDEKMIMKISFRTENFAQNWLPDVIFCSKKVSGRFRPAINFESQFLSGDRFVAKNYVQ